MMHDPVIRVLPDNIINKIAAGEVVDRPASVVKELMENALDAGAKSLEVTVVDGGTKLITIADDGCGMDRDSALLCLERHATSKIREVDDIERVATLGFRGEALAAIASVSRFTLTTRRQRDLTGTEVRLHGGRIEDVNEAGCPPGTRMEVRHLFHNVPARRKFLKSAATELNHIRHVFLLYALGRPDVALRLVVDEREVYRLDGDSTLALRIRQLYGSGLMNDLIPVAWQSGDWRITGLVSGPRLHRADKNEQYLFINGRPASAPVLGYAISEAWQHLLAKGRHPVLFLFLELPPGEVDVNVHPTKKEVRFRRSGMIRDAVMTAIRNALAQAQEGTEHVPNPVLDGAALPARDFLHVPDLPALPAFDYPRRKPDDLALPNRKEGSNLAGQGLRDGADSSPVSRAPWQWCRILGQIAGYYVVLETDEGMIMMDPQAAHERVLYERMLRDARRNKMSTQGLLGAEAVDLPPLKAGLIRKHLEILRHFGFGISEFGGDTFMVDAMPALLGPVAAADVLADIASELEMPPRAGAAGEGALREQIAQAAARMAVRTTTQLSREELERLIGDLSMAELPYTSPRGRPTLIFTSLQELKKKFGRD